MLKWTSASLVPDISTELHANDSRLVKKKLYTFPEHNMIDATSAYAYASLFFWAWWFKL